MQYINYRENKKRGTSDFPIQLYQVDHTHPQYVMSYHWHIEFEIIRILSGTFQMTLEGDEFSASADDLILIPAGFLHAGVPEDCIYDCIVFDMNLMLKENDACRRYIKQIISHEINPCTCFTAGHVRLHDTAWALFDALAEKKDGYQLIVKGCLFQLFGLIIAAGQYSSDAPDTLRTHNRIQKLKQVLEYIETFYASPITLDQLSKCVGMSPKYFCRFFQEMTHYTPLGYVNYYRIERACYQLITTDASITEAAYSSGFNDLSYFIKMFKKYKGITPKRYQHGEKSRTIPLHSKTPRR